MNTATSVAIGTEDGLIKLEFPENIRYAKFDPDTAKAIGLEMCKLAYGERFPNSEANGREVISAEIQNKILTRLTFVIKQLQEKGQAPGFIANEVMNIVLREVY